MATTTHLSDLSRHSSTRPSWYVFHTLNDDESNGGRTGQLKLRCEVGRARRLTYFEVMKISDRGTPLALMPCPTSVSFPYTNAQSRLQGEGDEMDRKEGHRVSNTPRTMTLAQAETRSP